MASETSTPAVAEESGGVQALFVRRPWIASRIGVTVRTLKRMVARGELGPMPVLKTSKSESYDRAEIEAWCAHRDEAGKLYGRDRWGFVWSALRRKAG